VHPISAQNYYTRSYNYRTGMPTSYFYDLEQDSLGRIWGVSAIGLYSFDGLIWKKHTIPVSEDDNREDPPKSLTIGHHNQKIVYYDDLKRSTYYYVLNRGKWKTFRFTQNPVTVKDLVVDDQDRVWIATMEEGLLLQDDQSFKAITIQNGLLSNSIYDIAPGKNTIYIGGENGLCTVDTKTLSVDTLLQDTTSSVNIIDYNPKIGLTYLSHPKDKSSDYDNVTPHILNLQSGKDFEITSLQQLSDLTTIVSDSSGDLYFGSRVNGLFKYAPDGTIVQFQQRNSPVANQLSDVLIGKENEIWLSHPLGINVFHKSQFYHFNASYGFAQNTITSIYAASDSSIYFGHTNGKISRLYHQQLSVIDLTPLISQSGIITDISETPRGIILFATNQSKLITLHPDGSTKVYTTEDGVLRGWNSFLQNSQGEIFLGGDSRFATESYGIESRSSAVLKIGEGYLVPFNDIKTAPDTTLDFSCAAFDNNNNLYVKFTTENNQSGILRYGDDGKKQYFTTYNGLFSNLINAIFVDSENRVWVAQRGGVSLYENNKWETFTADDNVLSSVIYSIFEDKDHNIWIIGNVDVSRYENGSITSYTFKEGLFEKEISIGSGASDLSNRIWIGTDDGIYMYDIDQNRHETPQISLEVANVIVDGISQDLGKSTSSIKLPYSNKAIEVQFQAIYLRSPEKVYYQTKLEGIDENWSPPTSRNSVVYNYLPPGKYSFSVRAGINGLHGSLVEKTLPPIVISQPFWRNAYVVSGFIISAFLIVMGFFQFKYTQSKKTERLLNRLVKEKTDKIRKLNSEILKTEEKQRQHIATEFHDRVAQYLAMAKLNIGFLKQNLQSTNYSDYAVDAYDLVDKSIKDTRLLIRELNPPVLHELGFEAAIQWLVEQLGETYGIQTNINNSAEKSRIQDLEMDMKIVLFQSTREILNNVVKHANAQHIDVRLWEENSYLWMEVEDNGIGFDADLNTELTNGDGGFGLVNVKERLNQIEGLFDIQSYPGKGTRVRYAAPMHLNHKHERD